MTTPATTELMIPEDLDPMEEEGLGLLGQAERLTTITDDDTFKRAGELLLTVKAFSKKVHELTDPVVSAAHLAHKAALKQQSDMLGHATQVEAMLKKPIADYEQGVKDRAATELRRATQQREQLEQDERDRAARETAALQQRAADAVVQAADEAASRGDHETAERIAAAPIPTVAPIQPRPVFVPPVSVSVPTVQGLSFRDNWKAEVTNLKELVDAVAAGKVSIACVEANMTALNGMARAQKGLLSIPGVKPKNDRTPSGRT